MMQAECDICGSAHSPAVNQIIFCDGLGCDVPIHQKCYNVAAIPDGPWYCKRCADKIPIYATTVVCCQQKNGALLRTSGKREYIHAVCAYWNPKISKQSDVIKVDPRLFAKKGCTICGIPTGLTVECSKAGCSREFHVTCALDTKILERTLKDFCNTDKLKCPKHFAVMAKENRKEQNALGHNKALHYTSNGASLDYKMYSKPQPVLNDALEEVIIVDRARSSKRDTVDQIYENRKEQNALGHNKALHQSSNGSSLEYKTFSKPQPPLTEALEEVITVDHVSAGARSSKRDTVDQIDSVERKMFKAEKGGTFEWLAEKIVSIQKAADAIGNLSPEFKAEIDKLILPGLSVLPIKRYSQDTTNEKEKDYQDLQKKYIAAQEEINDLRKEVGRFKDTQQSDMKKLDTLKQSLFRLLKFFDLPDHIKLHGPSDVENALAIICKELNK